jgi:putative transposase
LERGLDVPHEAIRQWGLQCAQDYAQQLKRRRAQPGAKWHVAEVCLTINGKRHSWWRAVDHAENVRDILGQSRRNQQAATQVFRTLLQGCQDVPRVIMPEKRKSYGAAKRERLPRGPHRPRR